MMCGIAGVLVHSGDVAHYSARTEAMTNALRHRGPDDGGVNVVQAGDPVTLFGNRRLAIIDLSPTGHQPMRDPQTGAWITFNGEIYNYRQLRNELVQSGQAFWTQTDTEVILKAYAAWGMDCVRRLRGIFAFAIWDPRTRSLFLARDQLGVKPLYLWTGDGVLAFASEIRALLASALIPRTLDADGLYSYLAYGSLQEPLTLVKGVRSLLPGHRLSWLDGEISYDRYWELPCAERSRGSIPADVYAQVRVRLENAVQEQLVSDAPLGAFLSGGIDSTAIAALMAKTANGPVKTFSLIFEDDVYDEGRYARIAAKAAGTEHTELLLTGRTALHALPDVMSSYDQPSVDGVNTYFVSKLVRQAGLTVALSGIGGDELFGGYSGFSKPLQAERWFRRMQILPSPLRGRIAAAVQLDALPTNERVRKMAALLASDRPTYFVTRQLFSDAQISRLLTSAVRGEISQATSARLAELASETDGYDPINRISALEMRTYMLSTLLRDADQMSMAHSLEVRVPLIDQELVEYVFTVPGILKTAAQQPKPLLTRALAGMLPSECVYRPKRGFELPFDEWLRHELKDEIQGILLRNETSHRLPFEQGALRQLCWQFEARRISWSRIWALYVLFHWMIANGLAY